MGSILKNHSYVDLSLVRNRFSSHDIVQCHTDLTTCCTRTQGSYHRDWIPPSSEARLPYSTNIFAHNDNKKVHLHRKNWGFMETGIYRCAVYYISHTHSYLIYCYQKCTYIDHPSRTMKQLQ